LPHREVFVSDSSFDFVQWVRLNEAKTALIKHPSAKHAVSNYANFVHKNGSYNFNTVDDYLLTIAASQKLSNSSAAGRTVAQSSPPSSGHSLLIWPDGIRLEDLDVSDVEVIGKYLLKELPLDTQALSSKLSARARVSSINETTIVMPISSTFTLNHALRTQAWFDSILSKRLPGKKFSYYIASELKTPNNIPTQVCVLPQDLCYADVHSEKRVEQIVDEIVLSEVTQSLEF
jgi:hypothetical protein